MVTATRLPPRGARARRGMPGRGWPERCWGPRRCRRWRSRWASVAPGRRDESSSLRLAPLTLDRGPLRARARAQRRSMLPVPRAPTGPPTLPATRSFDSPRSCVPLLASAYPLESPLRSAEQQKGLHPWQGERRGYLAAGGSRTCVIETWSRTLRNQHLESLTNRAWVARDARGGRRGPRRPARGKRELAGITRVTCNYQSTVGMRVEPFKNDRTVIAEEHPCCRQPWVWRSVPSRGDTFSPPPVMARSHGTHSPRRDALAHPGRRDGVDGGVHRGWPHCLRRLRLFGDRHHP